MYHVWSQPRCPLGVCCFQKKGGFPKQKVAKKRCKKPVELGKKTTWTKNLLWMNVEILLMAEILHQLVW